MALFRGAFGSLDAIVNTLKNATPLILAGFAVGIGFKAGLFNIGAQGQFLVGALVATAVALALDGVVPFVAIPLSLLGGMAGGLLYGMIPGVLKAFSGAHEVVTTIMLNYVAIYLVSWRDRRAAPRRRRDLRGPMTSTPPPCPSSSATPATWGSCSPPPRSRSCGGSCTGPSSASRSAPPAPTARRPATPG